MVREAELYQQDDVRKKKMAELRNNLDGLIYTTSKALEEYGNFFSSEEYNQILQDLEEAQHALEAEGNDYDRLVDIYQRLEQSSYRIAEAMYEVAVQEEEGHGDDVYQEDDYENAEHEEGH